MDIETIESEDRSHELMALARLVAFALESAKSLNAEVAEFCLDKALHAVLDQIDEPSRVTPLGLSEPEWQVPGEIDERIVENPVR